MKYKKCINKQKAVHACFKKSVDTIHSFNKRFILVLQLFISALYSQTKNK